MIRRHIPFRASELRTRLTSTAGFLLYLIFSFQPALAQHSRLDAQAVDLLGEIRDTLSANCNHMSTIGFDFSATHQYQAPSLRRPTADLGYFYMNNGRFFYTHSRTYPKRPNREAQAIKEELSYDGTVFYMGKPNSNGQGIIFKFLGDNVEDEEAKDESVTCPYFEAAGFQLPRTPVEWRNSSIKSIPLVFSELGEVVGIDVMESTVELRINIPEPAVINAKKVDLDQMAAQLKTGGAKTQDIQSLVDAYTALRSLKTHREVTFTLDITKGYAVTRRQDRTEGGKLIQDIECSDFVSTGDAKLWLPKQCIVRQYVKAPDLLNDFTDEPDVTTISLESLFFEPKADVTFALDYGAGTMVADRSSASAKESPKGQISHQTPATDAQLLGAVESTRSLWGLVVLLVNVVAVAILLFVIWKRRSAH